MKPFIISILLVLQLAIVPKLFSQNVSINSTGAQPDASAMLDVSSDTKGFLMPRLTSAQRDAITLPATGLTLFNTSIVGYQVNTGTPAAPVWSTLTTAATANAWSLGGNSVVVAQTIGTITNFDFPFITNNIEKMRLSAGGNLGIGATVTDGLNAEKLLVDAGTNSYNVISGRGNNTGYLQLNIKNTNSGTAASSDVVATNDLGTEANGLWFVDMGMNSSTYNVSAFSITGAGDAYLYTTGNDFAIGNATAAKSLKFFTGGTVTANERMRIDGSGNVGIGVTAPTAALHLKAGTGTAGTAPLKFTSGTLMSTAQVGAVEFLTDKFYGTITSSTARKEFTMNETSTGLVNTRVPFANASGRLTDLAAFTYATNRLSPTYITLAASTTSANTAPLKFTSGTPMTTAEAGAVEFQTDKFYGTITSGAARKEFTMNETTTGLVNTRVPFANSSGRLTDLAAFTYTTNRLSPTYITLGAGTATVGTAPLIFTSGTVLSTPIAGAVEYDGIHYYGTIGSTRYQLDQQTAGTNTGDVTIGTANGLSLAGQALSLGLASTSTTGALSSTDWNTFNNKGSGSVTSASVVTANGVSGTVATATTTPAITLTLGDITPTSVAASGTVGGSNLTGTNTGDQTITLTSDVTGSGTGSFATTIAPNAVTYGKIQAVGATSRLLGSSSTTTPVQEITLGPGLSLSGTTLTAAGSGGTVTTTSVVAANGLAGTVANATTAPAITLTTTVTGVVKGNGTAFSAATSGTDYAPGTSGNGTGIVKSTTGTGALTTAVAADFPTLNQNTSGTAANATLAANVTTNANLTGPVTSTGNATTITDNAVTYGKIQAVGATSKLLGSSSTTTPVQEITLGSGLSLSGTTLNAAGSGGTVTSASVVSANGLAGTVSNASTTPAITLTTTVTGIVKGNGTALSAATSGTDYAPGTSVNGTGIVKSTTGTGALTTAVAADFPTLNQNTTGTAANITGVLNAASHPALTGDVTNTAGTVATTITNNVVSNAKLATMVANTFKANNTGVTANATDITGTQATALLDVFTTTLKGLVPLSGGGTSNFLRADGTFAAPPGATSGTVTTASVVTANGLAGTVANASTAPAITLTTTVTGIVKGNGTTLSAATSGTDYAPGTSGNGTGIVKSTTGTGALTTAVAADFPTLNQNTTGTSANITGVLNAASHPALTGDVTNTAGTVATTITNNVVSNAKLATMVANTFKANNTGVTANATDITGTQATALLDVFTTTLKGLVPLSGGGTSNFLRADGTFAAPPGATSGTVTSVGLALPNIFTISNSPVTSSGTLTGTLNTQTANLVFAGPATGAATAPTFRTLVAADLPVATTTPTTGLGAISVGSGLAVTAGGVLSATNTNAGTVTSVSVTTANGVSGTVANATTTPAITIALGAITPTSVAATGLVTGSNLSGTNTGNQTITLTSDVTGSGTGSFATTIAAGAVSNAKLAQMPTLTLKGNNTGGTANASDLTVAQVNAILPVFTSTLNGLVPFSGGSAGKVLHGDGTWKDTAAASNQWSTTGNSGISPLNNFLGTTDNQSLRFRTNNSQRMKIDSTGNVIIGQDTAFDGTNPEKFMVNAGVTTSVNAFLARGSINNYFQMNIKNLSNGAGATTDIVATADNGTETANYVDLGINGSGYTGSAIQTGVANDGYLISAGNDFYMVNSSPNKAMLFLTGGTGVANERMRILANGRVGMGVQDPTAQFVVKDTMEIRRISTSPLSQLLFTNTATTGDFRIGGDGGDLYWQGGGGRALQMGSYWTTILGGDRQGAGGAYPAFINGIIGTGVSVESQRDGSVPLAIKAFSPTQSANLTEWRNSVSAVLSAVTKDGNFGIGTSTPATKLSVLGTITATGANPLILSGLSLGAGTDSILTITGGLVKKLPISGFSGGGSWSTTGNSGTTSSTNFLGTTDAQDLVFRANNIEKMRLFNANSEIKIGNADSAVIRSTKELILREDGDQFGSSVLRLRNRNGENGAIFETIGAAASLVDFIYKTGPVISPLVSNIRFETRAGNFLKVTGNSTEWQFGQPDATNGGPTLVVGAFGTGSNSSFRIGNLGIGNLNPAQKLDVTGNIRFSGALMPDSLAGSAGSILTSAGPGIAPTWAVPSSSGLWTTTGNTGTFSATNFIGTIDNKSFKIRTNNFQAFLVDSLGNVAVGLNPTFTPLTAREKFLVDAGSTIGSPTPAGAFNVISGKGYLDNYLQLNIQNNSPGAAASSDIVASNNAATETTNFIDMGINSSANGSTGILSGVSTAYLYATGNDFVIGNSTASRPLRFYTTNASAVNNEAMRIDSEGDLGIGLTNPSQKLDVTGNFKLTGAFMPNNLPGTAGEFLTSGGPGASPTWLNAASLINTVAWVKAGNGGTASATDFIGTTDLKSFKIRTNNAQAFLVDSFGNVAVGLNPTFTALPAREKFLVDAGTTTSVNAISGKGTIDSYFQLNIQNRSAGANASSDIVATSNNGDESNGFVNLGINSSAYNAASFNLGGFNDAYLYSVATAGAIGGNLSIGTGSAGKIIKFHTGGTVSANERMRIDENGNVGIGTTPTSSEKFHVFTTGTAMLSRFSSSALTDRTVLDVSNSGTNGGNVTLRAHGSTYVETLFGQSMAGVAMLMSNNSTGPFIIGNFNAVDLIFGAANTERMRLLSGGNFGIGVNAPTGVLHLKAGTTAAGTAPLKLTSGTNLTTAEAGAVEFDGTNYFATTGTTRYTLAKTLTATATIDFASTAASSSTNSAVITVTGAADGDVVSVGVPNAVSLGNTSYFAYVSAANSVIIRFINNSGGALDPGSATFRVSVSKY